MTTQRDRLAAVLTEAAAYVSPATHGRPERIEHQLWLAGAIASIDALLARGVRVVDADAPIVSDPDLIDDPRKVRTRLPDGTYEYRQKRWWEI